MKTIKTMENRNIKRLAAAVLAVNALCIQAVSAATSTGFDEIDEYKPILIDGDDIPAALEKDIATLSLQAVANHQMEPIPYQIDEYNTGGAVYFKEWNVPIDGTENILDKNDKLLFLFKDAGQRRTPDQIVDGNILAEVELTDNTNNKRYVYLVVGSRLHSEEQYVRYSTDIGKVETDFYQLTYNKNNQLNWDEFSYTTFQGDKPFDTMKIRMSGGLFTELSTITLNNNNLVAKPKGERVGPVRTTSQLEMTLWVFGLPVMEMSYQIHHYPKSMLYDARIIMPELRREIVLNPKLSMSIDANNLKGAYLRTASGPDQGAIVDGTLSDLEKELLKSTITPEKNWIWLSTKRHMDLLAFFEYLGDSRMPLSLVYADSTAANNLPERFPGEMPNIGYRIENFPKSGFFGFVVSLYLSEGFEGKPENFTESVRKLPAIRVFSKIE